MRDSTRESVREWADFALACAVSVWLGATAAALIDVATAFWLTGWAVIGVGIIIGLYLRWRYR